MFGTVEDNGIGFERERAKEIFLMFHRLHSAHEYLGPGIGLATCQRIIEFHGGRIWGESEPGKESKFHFTLRE
jgi:signal transduction histidine kinase